MMLPLGLGREKGGLALHRVGNRPVDVVRDVASFTCGEAGRLGQELTDGIGGITFSDHVFGDHVVKAGEIGIISPGLTFGALGLPKRIGPRGVAISG